MGNIFLSLSNILKLGNLTCVLVLGKEHSYGKSSPVGLGIYSALTLNSKRIVEYKSSFQCLHLIQCQIFGRKKKPGKC
jgi:hypothetical protein